MASTQVNPTRMELTKQKKKLVTAVRGHKLLKDKRDELMRQFLDLVRENMELRKKVEAGIRSANTNFVIAKAGMSEETLNTALMAPKQEVYLETGKKNVMSVDIPVFEYKTRTPDANDIYSYGFAFTSSDLDGAVKSLADILPDMLRLAEVEKAVEDGSILDKIYPVEKVLGEYPPIHANSYGDRLLENGNPLSENLVDVQHKEGWVRMYTSDGDFTGIFQWDAGKKKYYPVKMF